MMDDDASTHECGDIRESIELPLSQNTLKVLAEELCLENFDNVQVLSQGASQRSVGEIRSSLSISCFTQNKIVKNTPWIYSTPLERLFMKCSENVPILFKCEGRYDPEMCIAISVRFEDPQFQMMTLEVCPNHIQQNMTSGVLFPQHMIQYCGDKVSRYIAPPELEHYTVRIPVISDAFNGNGQTEFFQMSCLSSCVSVARKKILIHAELTYRDQILSKVSVPVKISASPLRDKLNEESKIPTENKEPMGSPPNKRSRMAQSVNSPSFAQQTEILVRVKGRKNCDELRKWLQSNVTPNHYAVYSQNK